MNPEDELKELEHLMNEEPSKIYDPDWEQEKEDVNARELSMQKLIYRYQHADEKEKEIIRNEIEKEKGKEAVHAFVYDAYDEVVPKSRR